MKEIKRIDPKSAVKVQAIISAVLGILFGWLYGLELLIESQWQWWALIWLGSILGYVIFGALITLLCVMLYNQIAKKIGGIKIDIR